MILPRFLPAEISAGPWVSQGQSQGQSQVSRPLAQPPFRTAYATRVTPSGHTPAWVTVGKT